MAGEARKARQTSNHVSDIDAQGDQWLEITYRCPACERQWQEE